MVFVIVAVLGAATYAGYSVSRRYAEREKFFFEARLFCDRLSSEIQFSRGTLLYILNGWREGYKSYLGVCIEKYTALLGAYAETDAAALKEIWPPRFLKPREYDVIVNLFAVLGRADAGTELKNIASARGALDNFYTDAAAEKKRYGALYTKLGFLAGLAVAVLIL